ncbi:hypothetical protein [Streptomyces kanamyceticus]|uniref:hypothetical protein n=1 Tax=Streptomyces kanamyceticus TaxID=1967 RepID=UPI0037DCF3E4
MRLTDDDRQMAVRDFFMPAQLLEFTDLADSASRSAWGRREFSRRCGSSTVRRLEGEPDAGALARWTPAPGGFRYELDTGRGVRADTLTWPEVREAIESRMTAVRYGALREAVARQAEHEKAYMPCPGPYADAATWDREYYRRWSRQNSTLQLRAAAALDAILPAAVAHPPLF